MITRFISEAEAVSAFDQKTFHSCTVSGFTSACGTVSTGGALPFSYAGRIIDRLGLGKNFNSAKVVPIGLGVVQASATSCTINYLGVSLGIQHSATTCSGGFSDYSTEDWPAEQAFQRVSTATSTGDGFYSQEAGFVSPNTADLMTTDASTSTSTGYATLNTLGLNAVPLDGAARFIRVIVAPHIETTGCGGSFANVAAALLFGHPDEAPQTSLRARVAVTSACSS